jgi:nucleotide-binding universal stress UspA family protein
MMMDGPIKKILVYIDGSIQSITAAQYSIALSAATRAELYALYVVNTRAISELVKARIFVSVEEEEYKRNLEEDAERYLSHVKTLASNKGVMVTTIRSNGTVNLEIKSKIDEYCIDLLVLGELSRIRSRRDEFYSETERVLRNVNCSVLIVKDVDRVCNLYDQII